RGAAPRPVPETPMKPALLALLLATAALAGCADPAFSSTLHIDFGGHRPTVDAAVEASPGDRPAASLRAAHGAPTPPFYTALDQVQQWSDVAQVPIEVSYSASFGFFLAKVDGLPASSSQAFWSLSVNGTESQVGMEQVPVTAGTRIAWTLTPLAPAASSAPLALEVPIRVETKEAAVFVNGTVTPGATVAVRGGPGAPTVGADGAWSYRIEPRPGRTNLTFTADDGRATRQANVTVVRLAAATLEVHYTMAVPPHPASSDLVWYDPDERAAAPLYDEKGVPHPPVASVHDLMVTWTRQTGIPVEYGHSASFGFSVLRIDGVGAPLSNGTPPYWCYDVNGESASLGITLQPVAPGDTIRWEFAGCT
ncbi:MAG TPA: DUF4430 domain-containing protein, partial [Candidatus Thermoplasmatota archaeon]|nr:DUF4430 domain-containing protein [Candidatus Thermoplasmatota archaeon]